MKLQIELWNGSYYCRGKFPDGKDFELKSKTDMTFNQWEQEYKKALEEHIKPKPEPDECQCPACNKTFVCPNRGI